MMVDGQIRPADITDPNVLGAMLRLPREKFLPAAKAALAYLDLDIPLDGLPGGAGRYLLKPMVIAKLIHSAEIGPTDRVLDVGCGTGYASAILSTLAGSVFALEENPALARAAEGVLKELGLANVTVVTGPLKDGWPAVAPYDVILLHGATEIVPRPLLGQLKDGGRLVGILGTGPAARAMLYRADHGDVSGRPIFDTTAPLLPGFSSTPAFVF